MKKVLFLSIFLVSVLTSKNSFAQTIVDINDSLIVSKIDANTLKLEYYYDISKNYDGWFGDSLYIYVGNEKDLFNYKKISGGRWTSNICFPNKSINITDFLTESCEKNNLGNIKYLTFSIPITVANSGWVTLFRKAGTQNGFIETKRRYFFFDLTTTGIEIPENEDIAVFYNNSLIIRQDLVNPRLSIFDMTGKRIYNYETKQLYTGNELSIEYKQNGLHFLVIEAENIKSKKKIHIIN